VKKTNNAFVIPFAGLKIGTHTFEFELDKAFFDNIGVSLIDDGEVKASLVFEKKETMMIADFSVIGHVHTTCDRCNDPIVLPVEGEFRIIYKFGPDSSDDENLIVLEDDAYEIAIDLPFYELMVISLPSRILHEQGKCNPEMMALYDSMIINANEPDFQDDEDWDDDEWDEEDEDWDEKEDKTDDDEDEESAFDSDDDNDKPIDPRWSILKDLK
jgi:uncharacterized metal-binding protein YceD (DUF177 family)